MIALSPRGSMVDADGQQEAARARLAVSETGPADAPEPLLDRVREAIFDASGHVRSHLQPVIRDANL